jgi:hypothetical protein
MAGTFPAGNLGWGNCERSGDCCGLPMTIISKSRSFIFVHLPKCGGTSVEQAFAQHAGWNDIIVGSTPLGEFLTPYYRWRYGLKKHSAATAIRSAAGPQLWDCAWKAALVRNPMRAFESLHGWIAGLADGYKTQQQIDHAEFVRRTNAGALPGFLGRSRVARAYAATTDFPQFIDAALKARLLPRSQTRCLSDGGRIIVDDVFKLEEIDRFWQALETRTGVKVERLHANRSARAAYHWDARHILDVAARFRDDFTNFGYEPV